MISGDNLIIAPQKNINMTRIPPLLAGMLLAACFPLFATETPDSFPEENRTKVIAGVSTITVGKWTYIHLPELNDKRCFAVSNLDFTLLRFGTFDYQGEHYVLLMGCGKLEDSSPYNGVLNITANHIDIAENFLPPPTAAKHFKVFCETDQAGSFEIVQPQDYPKWEVLTHLDALHGYYNENESAILEHNRKLDQQQAEARERRALQAQQPRRPLPQIDFVRKTQPNAAQ